MPGSRADRVRDLNLSIASINLRDDLSADDIQRWRAQPQPGKVFLPRVYFWDGKDRFQGPMRDIEVYWQRLDRYLAAMNLADFQGIVLAEENISYSGRPEVLTGLYRRIKAKYDVPVWQWWSPSSSLPESGGWIPADGWIIDPYFMPNPAFRRFVRKYLITGLPLVIMPWASTTEKSPPLRPEQWKANNEQLDVAVEFNLPVAFYWTYGRDNAGTSCMFGGTRGEIRSEWDKINHCVWDYIAGLPFCRGLHRTASDRHPDRARWNGQRPSRRVGPVDRWTGVVTPGDKQRDRSADAGGLYEGRSAIRLAPRVLGPHPLAGRAGQPGTTDGLCRRLADPSGCPSAQRLDRVPQAHPRCARPTVLRGRLPHAVGEDLNVPSTRIAAGNPGSMVHCLLMSDARQTFQRWKTDYGNRQTPEQIAAKQRQMRQQFPAAIGGLPERTSLEPQVLGSVSRPGYRVEKVRFQSPPKHYVSALLFLPSALWCGRRVVGAGRQGRTRGALTSRLPCSVDNSRRGGLPVRRWKQVHAPVVGADADAEATQRHALGVLGGMSRGPIVGLSAAEKRRPH